MKNFLNICLSGLFFFVGFAAFAQSPQFDDVCPNPAAPVIGSPVTFSPFAPPSGGPVTPPAPPPSDNYRVVQWVHGLQGNLTSWTAAAAVSDHITTDGFTQPPGFLPRRIISDRTVYPQGSNSTMAIASLAVANQLRNFDTDLTPFTDQNGVLTTHGAINLQEKNRNFVIAHSQGGIVARELARNFDIGASGFGIARLRSKGIATFNIPHSGVSFFSPGSSAAINTFVSNGISEGLSGAILANPYNPFGNSVFGLKLKNLMNLSLANLSQMVPWINDNNVVNAVATLGLTPLQLASQFPGTAIQLDPALPFFTTLTNSPTDITPSTSLIPHRAAIASVLNEPVLWRTLHYFDSGTNTAPDKVFTLTGDQATVNKVNNIVSKSRNWANHYTETNDNINNYGIFLSPILWVSYNIFLEDNVLDMADAWNRTGDWFEFEANNQWKVIIGARVTTFVDVCRCSVPGSNGQIYTNTFPTFTTDCNTPTPCATSWEFIRTTTTTELPNDGLLTVANQLAMPGTNGTTRYYDSSRKAEHTQARNSEHTKYSLLWLYEDENVLFFNTEIK